MIIFYTTDCPKCKILKKKLDMRGETYTVVDNVDEMIAKGFTSLPMLEVNGKEMTFDDAIRWLS